MMQTMTGAVIPMLTEAGLLTAAELLAQKEPFFARIFGRNGPPPLWERPPGFATLVWIILEQQVSLASARAAFLKVEALLPEFTPEAFLAISDETLKTAGFSRQKTSYTRILAEAIRQGALDLDGLEKLEDEAVRTELVRLKGIGNWTADIYLLMALRRPDIWPTGDLGLAAAVKKAYHLPELPTRDWLEQLGAAWRPYRAVATRMFWQYYLTEIRPPKNSQPAG